jgi:hypothetical protein
MYNDDVAAGSKTNYYKIATSVKAKINDYVTSTVRVVAGSNDNQSNLVGLNDSTKSDANPSVVVSEASFTVKTDIATVIAGKQAITTPWTSVHEKDGVSQTGTGILALIPAGPVTIAAAAFNQTNLDGVGLITTAVDALSATASATAKETAATTDAESNAAAIGTATLSTVGVLGTAGPVSFDAWYADVQNQLDSYTVGAKTTVGMVTLDARYTSLTTDAGLVLDGTTIANEIDNSLIDLKASAKFGAVNAWAQYGKTGTDGGYTASEASAKTAIEGWNVATNGKKDADFMGIGAGMDVMSDLNIALNYRTMDYTDATTSADATDSELYAQFTHSMGKNLSTYLRTGTYDVEVDSASTDHRDAYLTRIQVAYTF